MVKHSIVTKTGDDGKTFLLAGVRIPKNHIRVKSYGESDELNSILGLAQAACDHQEIAEIINKIQNQIFELGAILATPVESLSLDNKKKHSELISSFILFLEKSIDDIEPKLPELKNFILPGGSMSSSVLHVARTVCRRVERTIVELSEKEFIDNKILIYFNRLSDLLFILARYDNIKSNKKEIIWKSDN